jgi:peptidoglycan hydrolase-like protein with peptidoglycan-binding domain
MSMAPRGAVALRPQTYNLDLHRILVLIVSARGMAGSAAVASRGTEAAMTDAGRAIDRAARAIRTYALSKALRETDGRDVGLLQEFLNGLDLGLPVKLKIDCDFGANTEAAVKAFQRSCGLAETGMFHDQTLREAMARGYAPIDFPDDESMNRDEFPQNDPALQQPTAERTIVMLGGNAARFGFEFDGFRNGHNWIRYTDGWDRENIVKLPIEGLE